jgi:hypothetical protein
LGTEGALQRSFNEPNLGISNRQPKQWWGDRKPPFEAGSLLICSPGEAHCGAP